MCIKPLPEASKEAGRAARDGSERSEGSALRKKDLRHSCKSRSLCIAKGDVEGLFVASITMDI